MRKPNNGAMSEERGWGGLLLYEIFSTIIPVALLFFYCLFPFFGWFCGGVL
jgi:hypothetical protein